MLSDLFIGDRRLGSFHLLFHELVEVESRVETLRRVLCHPLDPTRADLEHRSVTPP